MNAEKNVYKRGRGRAVFIFIILGLTIYATKKTLTEKFCYHLLENRSGFTDTPFRLADNGGIEVVLGDKTLHINGILSDPSYLIEALARAIAIEYEKDYDSSKWGNMRSAFYVMGANEESMRASNENFKKFTGKDLYLKKEKGMYFYNPSALKAVFQKLYVSPKSGFFETVSQEVYEQVFRQVFRKYALILGKMINDPGLKTCSLAENSITCEGDRSYGLTGEEYAGLYLEKSRSLYRFIRMIERRQVDGTLAVIVELMKKVAQDYEKELYDEKTIIRKDFLPTLIPESIYEAINADSEILAAELEKLPKLDLNSGLFPKGYDMSPLIYAISVKKPGAVEILIEHGADVNLIDGYKRNTSIHYAAKFGDLKVMKILIDHEVNIENKNIYGNNAFHVAAMFNQSDIIVLLAKYSEAYNEKNRNGETPLDIAQKNRKRNAYKELKKLTSR